MTQDDAVDTFAALAQPSRLSIYRLLVTIGPDGLIASDIARRLEIVPSTLSGHLAILKRAGLLIATRKSREIHYAANLERMNDLVVFMLSDCCGGHVENCSEILTLLARD
ncbi:ArsR/SmtB family transcription factor [Aliiroseovarius crassostreae]|uniref:ArsR/SmtB family transcription factor n=1 Tax=Aliiroseovarius crassostreae TaxID=154981 RepID=UPI003C7ED9C6